MIQSVWKNLTGLQKAAEHLWCDFNEPQTHHQTLMTCSYGCRHFIHFKTVATELEIQFLSTLMSLLAQFGSAFSLLKKGCQYFCPYDECTKSLVFGDEFLAIIMLRRIFLMIG